MNNIVINDYFNSILEVHSTNYDNLLTTPTLIEQSSHKNNIFNNTLLLSELDIFTKKSFSSKKKLIRNTLDNYLKQKIKYNFNITIVNNNKHNCCICLEIISQNEQVYNLNCGGTEQPHIYHKSCFEKWNKNSCPYCRSLLH